MKLSEKLLVIANWLENANNELLCEAEHDEKCLSAVASAFTAASELIKAGAEEVQAVEPQPETLITPESLDEMAAIAKAFDESGDPLLKKQASVLDELLLTLGSPKNWAFNFKRAEENKIDELKKKYKGIKEQHDDMNKVSDQTKDIEKSPAYKTYRPLEAPLSTRCCPDHSGAQMQRIGDHIWQCSMDKKIYNYERGYTTLTGNKIPGGSVEEQTPNETQDHHQMFDTRESRLGLSPQR